MEFDYPSPLWDFDEIHECDLWKFDEIYENWS